MRWGQGLMQRGRSQLSCTGVDGVALISQSESRIYILYVVISVNCVQKSFDFLALGIV